MPGVDYSERPFLVIWELTQACDLACVHCRASAEPDPHPGELTREEGLALIDQVAEMKTPILVFSGGDPLKRPELPEFISHAKKKGLRTGTIPAVTPRLNAGVIQKLRESGLDQIAFSLDAANAKDHDAFRKTEGVFERTLASVREAHRIGLAVQINSLINVHNETQLKELVGLVKGLPIVFWEVFFLVPTGRGTEIPLMIAEQFENSFRYLYELSREAKFLIKVTEAPHYRRYYMESLKKEPGVVPSVVQHGPIRELPPYLKMHEGPGGSMGRAPMGVNAGKGFVFIAHDGEVFPSGFLPLSAGSIRKTSLSEIYRNAPVMKELRDSSLLKGRCGRCEYRDICGGSRSRAYALTGDYLAEDPACLWEPAGQTGAAS